MKSHNNSRGWKELAEFLLRRFKNAQDVQDWEETVLFAGLANLEPEIKLILRTR